MKFVSFLESTSFPDQTVKAHTHLRCLDITPIKTSQQTVEFTPSQTRKSESKDSSPTLETKDGEFTDTSIDLLAARVKSLLGKSAAPMHPATTPTANGNRLQQTISPRKVSTYIEVVPSMHSTNTTPTASFESVINLQINNTEHQSSPDQVQKTGSHNESSSILFEANRILEKIQRLKEKFQSGSVSPSESSSSASSSCDNEKAENNALNLVRSLSVRNLDDIGYLSDESEPTEYYPIAKFSREPLQISLVDRLINSVANCVEQNEPSRNNSRDNRLDLQTIEEGNVLLLIERQRSYLDTIQRELSRLEKIYCREQRSKKKPLTRTKSDTVVIADKCRQCNQKISKTHSSVHPRGESSSSLPYFGSAHCCQCDYHRNRVWKEHQQFAPRINQAMFSQNCATKHCYCHWRCSKMDPNSENICECLRLFHLNSPDQNQHPSHDAACKDNKSVQTSIIVDKKSEMKKVRKPTSWFVDLQDLSQPRQPTPVRKTDLQDAFDLNCHQIKLRSSMRIQKIKDNAELRMKTAEQRRDEIAQTFFMKSKIQTDQRNNKVLKGNLKTRKCDPDHNGDYPRPLSFTTRNVFTHREMRAQTEKIYRKLPEVRAQRVNVKREDDAKRRRMMANIFKQRLKENAIRGKLNWPITSQAITA